MFHSTVGSAFRRQAKIGLGWATGPGAGRHAVADRLGGRARLVGSRRDLQEIAIRVVRIERPDRSPLSCKSEAISFAPFDNLQSVLAEELILRRITEIRQHSTWLSQAALPSGQQTNTHRGRLSFFDSSVRKHSTLRLRRPQSTEARRCRAHPTQHGHL